jgi:hypothetical protein
VASQRQTPNHLTAESNGDGVEQDYGAAPVVGAGEHRSTSPQSEALAKLVRPDGAVDRVKAHWEGALVKLRIGARNGRIELVE